MRAEFSALYDPSDSPSPSHCLSPTSWKILDSPIPPPCWSWVSVILHVEPLPLGCNDELLILWYQMLQEWVMAPNCSFQRSLEMTLSAGIKGKGRQNAREDPEELDMPLLI